MSRLSEAVCAGSASNKLPVWGAATGLLTAKGLLEAVGSGGVANSVAGFGILAARGTETVLTLAAGAAS